MMDLGIFTKREELITAVKNHYLAQSVRIVLHKHSDHRKVTFKCYHGGKYRRIDLSEVQRKRKTKSRLIDCPFQIKAMYSKKENQWKIKIVEESHNHPLAGNVGGNSTVAGFTDEKIDEREGETLLTKKRGQPKGIREMSTQTDQFLLQHFLGGLCAEIRK